MTQQIKVLVTYTDTSGRDHAMEFCLDGPDETVMVRNTGRDNPAWISSNCTLMTNLKAS